jgi:hypothetical protein
MRQAKQDRTQFLPLCRREAGEQMRDIAKDFNVSHRTISRLA